MVYNEKFVAVVKCNGKILREKNNVVSLPFGANYSILFKNLDSRKAEVHVSIDGKDVLDDSSLLIHANTNAELLGVMQGNSVNHSFKFIQKTQEISDHRGDEIDDGIIRIEYAFEKEKIEYVYLKGINETHEHHHVYHHQVYNPPIIGDSFHWTNSSGDGTGVVAGVSRTGDIRASYCSSQESVGLSNNNITCDSLSVPANDEGSVPANDEGITVQGNRTHQDFVYSSIGDVEESNVIILKLRGYKPSGVKISKPLTVRTKLVCPSCGKKSSSSECFCSRCGTNLES
jgi:hypothetical protein